MNGARTVVFVVGILAGWTSSAAAQVEDRAPAQGVDDLRELLAPLVAQHAVPALGAAVVRDGRLCALGAAGVRKRGDPTPVTDGDRWHLGSCTKAMTATLLALDVEAGRTAWNTPMVYALPDLAAGMDRGARAITVAQLLQHRSGLPSQPPEALWNELFRYAGSDGEARTEVAATLLGAPPEAPPGDRFRYSNAGYMVAGAVIDRAGRGGWQTRLTHELFGPLGMTEFGFGPPGSPDAVDEPWGHRSPNGATPQPVFFDNPASMGPAGTVHCTLRDWAKFVALHLGVGADGPSPLLQPETLRCLHTPPGGADYALGWVVTQRGWAPGPILTHSGSNTLWFCVAWLAPAAKFAVLVTCNQGDTGAACDAVAASLIGRYRPAAR